MPFWQYATCDMSLHCTAGGADRHHERCAAAATATGQAPHTYNVTGPEAGFCMHALDQKMRPTHACNIRCVRHALLVPRTRRSRIRPQLAVGTHARRRPLPSPQARPSHRQQQPGRAREPPPPHTHTPPKPAHPPARPPVAQGFHAQQRAVDKLHDVIAGHGAADVVQVVRQQRNVAPVCMPLHHSSRSGGGRRRC